MRTKIVTTILMILVLMVKDGQGCRSSVDTDREPILSQHVSNIFLP